MAGECETDRRETDHSVGVNALCAALPPWTEWRVDLYADSDVRLDPFTGSAWRGLLGHGLKDLVCVTGLADCRQCSLFGRCLYARLFETPAASVGEHQVRYATPSHPFVLRVPLKGDTWVPRGRRFGFSIVLFGDGETTIPYLREALVRAGRRGIAPGAQRFSLADMVRMDAGNGCVAADTPVAEPVSESTLAISFETPLRIKHRGRFVAPDVFSAEIFVTALLRRCQALASYFGAAPAASARGVIESPSGLVLESQALRWVDLERYSSRQRTRMQIGGVVGQAVIGGHALPRLRGLILAGQHYHVGKLTSMGLGRYTVDPDGSLHPRTP